jgi:hypothetical protein
LKTTRQRGANLGRISIGGILFTVTYRNGWLRFHKYRSHGRIEAVTLEDAYQLARRQRAFAFMP